MIFPLLQNAVEQLQAAHKDTPRLEAELLLCATLNCSRSDIILKKNESLSEGEEKNFQQLLQRRLASEPMAYILGYKDFWTRRIKVTPDVLIPRPETEHLVEAVLEKFSSDTNPLQLLDLCTGSGCIPAALASELPHAQFTLTDISKKALDVAKENMLFAQARTQFLCGNLFEALPHCPIAPLYNVITANPPYGSETDYENLEKELKHEPKNAIVAGNNGLAIAEQIIKTAPKFLVSRGFLFLEMGYDQALVISHIAEKSNCYREILIQKDLAGIYRTLIAQTD
ncbi:MAG: protein-(glutamine-N5) methyltransferase, release factor-specific [Deltaproteobacteria bacterium CG11_big_fil_rev_8_21_14_0_20_42_23]|nr:MAG: protein-(glutamine-N5) methyltransferase, release factor-specific [Deltaproteobacteria bacterium CG11_big_fil_rev_8_21_14_0_20_42_23]PJC64944.1 MAG: peptide chain release factor N(5)-glutamine methyltransferase [Deltaproteobacteria bacterium CG_4_9_14_0_2_um_filter_42_21]